MLSYKNSKIRLTGKVYGLKSAAFDLPAGFTCPMANLCHSRTIADPATGKRHVEHYGVFTCYATKAEAVYTPTYNLRWRNFDATKQDSFVADIINEIQANKIKLVRVHSSGDFYNFGYFQKWIQVAEALPDVIFFGYTKQASFAQYLSDHKMQNFKLHYSMGGKMDTYAVQHNLPRCYVVQKDATPEYPVICTGNHDVVDFEYIMRGESFSIQFH